MIDEEYDFANLTHHLTNEQKVLLTLERIEVLLQKLVAASEKPVLGIQGVLQAPNPKGNRR